MIEKDFKLIIHDEDEIFERIDSAYGSILRSIAWEILKNRQDVEDCLNEARLKLSRHLDKLGDLDSTETKAYICKTVKSTAIDIYRKKKNEPLAVGIGSDVREWAVKEGKHQLDVIARYELAEDIRYALDLLHPIERAIIILHRCYDCTYEEIGKELGMSKDAVRKRADRAIDALKRKLGKRKQG